MPAFQNEISLPYEPYWVINFDSYFDLRLPCCNKGIEIVWTRARRSIFAERSRSNLKRAVQAAMAALSGDEFREL